MYPPIPDHYQATLEPVDIEVEMTGLDDQGYVDIGSNHLVFDDISCSLATQKRLSRNDVMNYAEHVGAVVLNAYPISNTGEIH